MTLHLNQNYLKYIDSNKTKLLTAKKDKLDENEPSNKTHISNTKIVDQFIKSLSTILSHYCRTSS